jgi:hypothetical protein
LLDSSTYTNSQLSLVSSPFIGGRTPLIRCFCNSSSFHPCMRKGLRLLSSSRAQETSYYTIST